MIFGGGGMGCCDAGESRGLFGESNDLGKRRLVKISKI